MTKRFHLRKKIVFFLILLLVVGVILLLYFFLFKKKDDPNQTSPSITKKNQQNDKKKVVNEQDNLTSHSLIFLNHNLKKINFEGWKRGLKINYVLPPQNFFKMNDYQIKSFSFQPLYWEEFVVKQILEQFHSVNLVVTFQYFNDFKECLVKISYQKKPNIFVEKFFQIS